MQARRAVRVRVWVRAARESRDEGGGSTDEGGARRPAKICCHGFSDAEDRLVRLLRLGPAGLMSAAKPSKTCAFLGLRDLVRLELASRSCLTRHVRSAIWEETRLEWAKRNRGRIPSLLQPGQVSISAYAQQKHRRLTLIHLSCHLPLTDLAMKGPPLAAHRPTRQPSR